MKAFLTLLISAIFLQSSAQLTLDECQEKARINYPLIKQLDLIEMSSEYTVSNANKAYLPQLSITAIGGIIDGIPQMTLPGMEASSSNDFQMISIVQFNQVLWDGGITKSRKEIARKSAEIEKANVEISFHALKERVNNLYFGVLIIDEQSEQLSLLLKNLKTNRKSVVALLENGVAHPSDLDELNYQILSSEQKLQELESNRRAYVNMLSALIGTEISEDVDLEKPLLEAPSGPVQITRPELDLFNQQLGILKSKDDANKSRLYPKVGLMGFGTFVQPEIAFGTEEINRILVAGLSLSWELGGLYQRGNDRKLNQLEYDKINTNKETFLFTTELQLTQAREDIERLQKTLIQDEEMVKLKGRIKNTYQARYDNGSSTMNELLIRINEENMARQNLILHEMQYLMALYNYKNIAGN